MEWPSRKAPGKAIRQINELRWLEADLAKVGKDRPVVMMMHIPLLSVQNQYNLPAEGPNIIGKAKVMELIKTHNVRLVLQGHHHFWEDILVLGRTRFIIGGAIAGRPSWRGTENGPQLYPIHDPGWRYQLPND